MAQLEQLEGIIRENVGAFYEVGMALMKIRDQKYYHDVLGIKTPRPRRKRWDIGRNYMNKLIASSVVMENLGTIVPNKPTTESRVRPLTRFTADQQLIAWQKAVDTARGHGGYRSTWAIVGSRSRENEP